MPMPMPNDEYKINLEVFEGPLDLLLYLIRRDELNIYDIPIEHITEQYSKYLNTMKMLDLTIAGEFIVMAAQLTLIKSRMLLPADEEKARDEAEDEDEGLDPRWDLVRQLVEYKKFKDAASRLQEREFIQQNIFSSGGEATVGGDAAPDDKPLGDIGLFDLLTAFNEVLANAPVEPIGEIEPIRWTVPDKIDMIIRMVRGSGEIAFSRLFHPQTPRGEIIVTFLALLELIRLRQVTIAQSGQFAEITIAKVPEGVSGTELPPPIIGGGNDE